MSLDSFIPDTAWVDLFEMLFSKYYFGCVCIFFCIRHLLLVSLDRRMEPSHIQRPACPLLSVFTLEHPGPTADGGDVWKRRKSTCLPFCRVDDDDDDGSCRRRASLGDTRYTGTGRAVARCHQNMGRGEHRRSQDELLQLMFGCCRAPSNGIRRRRVISKDDNGRRCSAHARGRRLISGTTVRFPVLFSIRPPAEHSTDSVSKYGIRSKQEY